LKLRTATAGDVPALAALARLSYEAAFAHILDAAALASRGQSFFEERFSATWRDVVVAVAGDALVGFILVKDRHIDMLFLDPSSRGKGIGATLLEQAERQGAETLECFRDNHEARRFYERHGWRVEKEYEREFAGRTYSFVFYRKGSALSTWSRIG
jgi:putative acetyltransferase